MMKRAILMIGALGAMAAGAGQAQELRVTLQGVEHARGQLSVGVYAEPKTFRKERLAYVTKKVPAAAGEVTVVFDALPPGRYAVMAYHDENGNGELDRRLGMFPTEGYALSNNPKVMGPPGFDDSAFEVGAQAVHIDLQMRY